MNVAQEWLNALRRTDTTGQRLFGSKELGEIEIERKPSKAISIKSDIIISMNSAPTNSLIDKNMDLTKVSDKWLTHSKWILHEEKTR